ncbi:MAG: NAD(P)H-quinone oxidoreductase subunit 2, chloroplastic [Gemmatimonadaceae bacterium]|nr:NAD(P)H-quinone oxidoreductase subunit 2, chloroplastic [Gemmatimonadaceae bacterium]
MRFDLSRPFDLAMAMSPDLFLFVGAMALLLWSAIGRDGAAHQRRIGVAAIAVAAATLLLVVAASTRGWSAGPGIVAVDGFRWAADLVFLVGAIIAIAMSLDYNAREAIFAAEAHVLILLATGGMMLMVASRDLMMLFLGIETMSIAVYILTGIDRRSPRAAEGALKYFLLGAFSTAFFLYGIALIYGATGATNFQVISERIVALKLEQTPMLLVGVALLLVGFGFKMAAAPFHMWAPDVYEGAPTPITAFMAASVKAAAFAAFLRVWLAALGGVYAQWHDAIWWLSAITMCVGNIVALQQRNLKRMIAYSSVGHTGFILVAVASGTTQSAAAFLFYLVAYTFAIMGAFAVIVALGSPGAPRERIDDYNGLWFVRPGMAIAMAVFMLAMLGFPVFGGMGFFAKWYVLQAALQASAPQTRLAVLLVLTTTISAGYYLYVVMAMFMKPRPEGADQLPPTNGLSRFIIAASAGIILIFGVFPDPVARWTRTGVDLVPLAPQVEPNFTQSAVAR